MLPTYITRSFKALFLAAALVPAATSCTNDLDQEPSYLASPDAVYRDPAQIQQVLARLYATLAVSGQNGGTDRYDLQFVDAGYSNYMRAYWVMQELTTDEAIIAWGDPGLPELNTNTWNPDNQFIRAMYDKIYFQISGCNDFLRNTSDEQLATRGIIGTAAEQVRQYRAEARFLRALSYYHALDFFGNVPFVDENFAVGTGALPTQISRADLFTFIETELKAIEPTLLAPRTVYGRADQGACWTLLTKLYLNAQVYTNTARNTEAVTYANKVLASNAGYALTNNYRYVFLADNNTTARNEIIFPVENDGQRTQNFGNTTFLVHASVGGSMSAAEAGVNGGWYGIRLRPSLVDLFLPSGTATTTDTRALFYTAGQSRQVNSISSFNDGYASTKWRNVTSAGVPGSGFAPAGNGDFVDTDYPLFRLSDVKLMYAEAVLRGGTGGTAGTPLEQVNQVRARAGAQPLTSVSEQAILDERGRELYWEGHRRTDLIRFNKYVSGYNWAYKGSTTAPNGQNIAATRILFPLPNTDLVANPNLKQNQGY
jgi:hypothetical protein